MTTTTTTPRHEVLVALHVSDEATYAAYRAGMTPILEREGGFFRRDFRVSEVLRGGDPSVNRVFILSFPDEPAKDRFFADEGYRKVRAERFDASVSHVDTVASYDADTAAS
jgi:uncharacterized protein (DUF1330 family)